MKTTYKTLLTFILLIISVCAVAQNTENIKALIDRGVTLNDSGKYTEAIDKYKEALKLDPENYRAYYEMSYTLYASGKGKEAIPYLEKAIGPNSSYKADGYDLLGNIYDDDHQPDKAIEYYKEGIKANPQYQRLYFNIGITYLRQKKYDEAETFAIDAIKLDPKHASSHRIYALATYYQNKRGCSLLAWCNFLILEPQTKRSPEAYAFIKKILNFGITRTDEKHVNINISPSELSPGNLAMPLAVLAATDSKKDLTSADSLALQLASVFKISGELEGNKKQKAFFSNFYAKFFEKLASSDNMPAFARVMSINMNKKEDLEWTKENDKKLKDLNDWLAATQREF